jgi:hypothetical protein
MTSRAGAPAAQQIIGTTTDGVPAGGVVRGSGHRHRLGLLSPRLETGRIQPTAPGARSQLSQVVVGAHPGIREGNVT